MNPLSYAFQFVKDAHVNIPNQSGGEAKFSQDYYTTNSHTNIHHYKTITIR